MTTLPQLPQFDNAGSANLILTTRRRRVRDLLVLYFGTATLTSSFLQSRCLSWR